MELLMASPELAPIVKVGPLADAVAALAKTLSRLDNKVTVALPRYGAVEEAGLMLARRLTPLSVEVGGQKLDATLFDARLGSGVELLLIDLDGMYQDDAIYAGDDDARRFGLFCRALAALVELKYRKGTPYDAVHCHDWPTALLPYLLAKQEERPRTVLTVHDASHQGRFDKRCIDAVGLEWDDFHPDGLEFYGDVSFLKAGVLAADEVTTVSPTYAQGLRNGAGGGLEGVFESRGDRLTGIVNGIDFARWSPSIDPHLISRYDAEDVANKGRCKAALLHELDLPLEPDRPLLVSLCRIDESGGADLLVQALPGIIRSGARLVVAAESGDVDSELVAMLEDLAETRGDDVVYLGEASEPLTHRLFAAADAFVAPARFVPCGLTQQIAQRYGAVPIAHAAGGMVDTIVDCDAHCETGTGFLYGESTAADLLGAVQRAVAAMKTPAWGALRRRVMRLDVSWERPARRYARLYR